MRALLIVLMMALPAWAAAAELQSFDADSLSRIRRELAGRPFVLALWSVHCEPCREEMPHWRALRAAYPDVPVVLVAADEPGERDRVRDFLSSHDLADVRTYAFDDAMTERLRYSVDPKWRGELPRTYYYDAAHRVRAKSGRLSAAQWEQWLGTR